LVLTPQTSLNSGVLFDINRLDHNTSHPSILYTKTSQDLNPRYYSITAPGSDGSTSLHSVRYEPSWGFSQDDNSGLLPADRKIFPGSEFLDKNNDRSLNGISDTNIDVWYGYEQDFGQLGNPQQWVNILGNVSDPDDVTSLSYTLNGGSQRALSIGPDNRRLALPGDFNIDIDRADLLDGANQVVITAVDGLGNQTSTTVTVNYTSGNTWPLPYSIDWSTTTDIQQVAQVVDGEWSIQPAGLRIDVPHYDRIVAIGDVSWTDYEVLVPITIHYVDYDGVGPVSGAPGVGVLMRWQGHTDDPISGWQPKSGWLPHGNIGWFRFYSPEDVRLQWQLPRISQSFFPDLETTYMFRLRVESTPGTGGLYSLKVWEAGQTEPADWNLSIQDDATDLPSGSFLLLAHHVDATYGDVTVTPFPSPSYNLSLSTIGNGSVTKNPDKDAYSYNEIVALEAFPAPGWSFSNWSGDIAGSENPITVTMIDDISATANFTTVQYLLTLDIVGNGTVTKDPDQSVYNYNDLVTLAAEPDPGWTFTRWSGDVSTSINPLEYTVQDDTNITATFTQNDYILTVNSIGNGSVTIDPTQPTYNFNDKVTLTAIPDPGWTFAGWSGDVSSSVNPLDVIIQDNSSIFATFTQSLNTLKIITVGNGSVSIYPEKTNFVFGEIVRMTAVADPGWSFTGWSGDASGSVNPLEYTIQGDTTITATFTQDEYTLNVNTLGSGFVDIAPEKEIYSYGDMVTLTATPDFNWFFEGWGGDHSGNENPITFLIEQDTYIIATFDKFNTSHQYIYYFPLMINNPW
jgi:uncharacterized repeat protein (TIGR02543 family)